MKSDSMLSRVFSAILVIGLGLMAVAVVAGWLTYKQNLAKSEAAAVKSRAICQRCPHAWQENVKLYEYGSHPHRY